MTTTYAPTTTARTTFLAPEVLGEFERYREAERLVDRLSDDGFPVGSLRIVGNDVHTVEQVTGRLTKGRAALAGAAAGAWVGLFVGLLFALVVAGAVLPLLLGSLALGALWGAALGFAGHWMTRGRRDFSSTGGLVAERYQVQVAAPHADDARERVRHWVRQRERR